MEISLFLKKQRKMVQHISDFRVFHIKNGSEFSNLCFTFNTRIYEKIRADLPAFSRPKHDSMP